MPKSKYNFFAIWLGLTVLGLALLVFLLLVKWQPDFFRDVTFVL